MLRRCSWTQGLARPSAIARIVVILGVLTLPATRADALPVPVNDSADAKSAAMRTRVYVGMWSTHLRDLNEGLAANSLIGFAYRGFYGATFINSFGDRALSLGLQRSFSRPRTGNVTMSLGYRAGVITGYDERFFGVGDKLPVVPFVQFVAGMDVRNAGIELGYAGVVASIMTSWRF